MSERRPKSSITHEEWANYAWEEVTTREDPEPMFILEREFTPKEKADFAEVWSLVESLKGMEGLE